MKKACRFALSMLLISSCFGAAPGPTAQPQPRPAQPANQPLISRDEQLRQAYIQCFATQDKNECIQRLKAALEQYKGTSIEDDLMIAMADGMDPKKEGEQAVDLLKKVSAMENATVLDTATMWTGAMSAKQGQAEILCRDYFGKTQPTPSRDLAQLRLATLHLQMGKADEGWKAMQVLRDRYPSGQLIQEDLAFADELRSKRLLAQGPLRDNDDVAELLTARQRPHMQCLRSIVGWFEGFRGKPSIERPMMDRITAQFELVFLYHDLLTKESLAQYAKSGFDLTQEYRKTAPEREFGKLDEMAAIFQKHQENK